MLNKTTTLIKYWKQISSPTVLIPIKNAVKNANNITLLLLIFSSKNKLSTIVNEIYVLIIQNDKNGMSFSLNWECPNNMDIINKVKKK